MSMFQKNLNYKEYIYRIGILLTLNTETLSTETGNIEKESVEVEKTKNIE